tara:strand:- start:200 stop:370 length:171 start_codon:yes stop_codon:yes gene_type:complete
MKKIILFFFLASCSAIYPKNSLDSEILNFDKNLTFNEFKNLLEKYNQIKSFPDIDK